MFQTSATRLMAALMLGALTSGSAVAASQARGAAPAASQAPGVVAQVRTAIGHGDSAAARRLASASADEATRELGLALVEMFEGKDDQAEARLTPLATRFPGGEAALELGLLEIRRGRREAGERRLDPIAAVRTFNNPDDYFRLARAAIGIREFLLANDAFQRVQSVARADIQAAWGDLFLRRHQPGDAVTSYQDALKADPDWIAAYVGIARALADENPPAAEAALGEAAKRAPNHPDVWLLTAEMKLGEDDLPAARQALDRAAAARPGSLEEAAIRAAVAYKQGGLPAVDAAMPAVRAANPRSALGYRMAADRAAQDYRFADAVALAQKAVQADADDPAAQFAVGLYLTRTGDESDARPALERSWELDKSAPVTKNLLDLLDHLDTFAVVSAPNTVFKFSKEEAAVLEVYALPLVAEAYATFTRRYDFTPQGPILIEVFPTHDDFAVRTLGLPGLVGALGACFGRVVTMDSPSARRPGEFSWQATLWHELAHVFSLQLSDYRVPRWLTEGISVYEEYRRVPAWGRELTLEYARALGEGKTFGVKGLPDAFKRPESLAMAYFEASLVVEHLVDVNGDQGLRTLLRAYADGATDEQAFARAFGQSVDAVEASFSRFIDGRYAGLREAMKNPPTAAAPDDLGALRARATAAPGNYVSQLTFGQALIASGDLAGARPVLRRAAELAPEASGDGSPQALLAAIAQKEGDLVAARKAYRALLEADHANVGAARRLLAISGDAPGDEDYALRVVADLDPFDADAHARLGGRLFARNEFGPALVEYRASLALGPANRAETHADIAATLLKLGRRDEAKRAALEALKEAPTFARAQDLLLEAIGR